jgi:hypothetical protein
MAVSQKHNQHCIAKQQGRGQHGKNVTSSKAGGEGYKKAWRSNVVILSSPLACSSAQNHMCSLPPQKIGESNCTIDDASSLEQQLLC